jgi:GMP synthase-like glutamine amidotransferase
MSNESSALKKPKILFIYPQSRSSATNSELPSRDFLLRQSFGLSKDDTSLQSVYIVDDGLPNNIDHDALIIGGSQYSVYDDFSWIRDLEKFILKSHKNKKPILGICFGHQIIAQALGGTVKRAYGLEEVGATRVDVMADEGINDPLFYGIEKEFLIGTFHYDRVVQPPNVTGISVLAKNNSCAFQSLAIGKNIRTVQFHPEFTNKLLPGLLIERKDLLLRRRTFKSFDELRMYNQNLKKIDIEESGRRILKNFYQYFILNNFQS